MNVLDKEPITIRQACARLGVSDRALRRDLFRPEYKDRLQTVIRQTRTGPRQAYVLPPDLVQDLAQALQVKRDAIQINSEDRDQVRLEFESVQRLTESYERLLAEKDSRIGDLTSRLENLEVALAREQEAHARLSSSLNTPRPIEEPKASLLGRLMGKGRR